MEVKIKKVENIILSLNHEEAVALQSILNFHSMVTKVPPQVHSLAGEIWDELNELGVASVET